MIVPVRCWSCGKPIAQNWETFKKEVSEGKNPKEVLDNLSLTRYCCRMIFLGHIDLMGLLASYKRN
jgi:DNA-directed RNA polymerase subunit N